MKKHITRVRLEDGTEIENFSLVAKADLDVTHLGRAFRVPKGGQFYLQKKDAQAAVDRGHADFHNGILYGPVQRIR